MKKMMIAMLLITLVSKAVAQTSNNLIFENTFENSVPLKKWYSMEKATDRSISTSDSVARHGKYSMRVQVNKGDNIVNNGKRAELTLKPESQLKVERWVGFSIFLPSTYIADPEPEILMQWHDVPDLKHGGVFRVPPIDLMTRDGHWIFDRRWAKNALSTNANRGGSIGYDLGPYQTNAWTDFVLHVIFSYDDDGLLEVWQNGKKVQTIKGPNCYNDPDGNYLKLGIYKYMWLPKYDRGKSSTSQRVVFYDDIRVGNEKATYKDVAP